MYKTAGLALILISSVMLFMKKSIQDYTTYKFLRQTSEICRYLDLECSYGKNYKTFFDNLDKKSFSFYKNFEFPDIEKAVEELKKNSAIHNAAVSEANDFFTQIGKRSREKETEFLKYNLSYFDMKASEYKSKYEKNKQLNLVSGISAGLMMIILIL